jgi:hypothetical protein
VTRSTRLGPAPFDFWLLEGNCSIHSLSLEMEKARSHVGI